jgi:exopolyphosphatase/guanosine-5'-triphosphate,3'-diphosphate pyrophosphatase
VVGAEEEAWLAGEGVLSAIPEADGIVGDLGGGSLELVEVGGRLAGRGISLPLGVLRAKANSNGEKQAGNLLRRKLAESGLAKRGEGRRLYLVGGSWRALARIDMILTGYPLPVIHSYAFAPTRIAELRQTLASPDPEWTKMVSPARLASTPVAAMLLDQLVQQIRPLELVVSSFGIREGLLFSDLGETVRKQDPLIAAARYAGGAERRFGEHGDILDAWIGRLFDDSPARSRIRLATCLLADLAWQATPEFRADRSIEMALHGNWTGVIAAERVMMAQALSSSFGRDKLPDQRLAELCSEDDLRRARQWGSAIRLAQRLSAGAGSVLRKTAASLGEGTVQLSLPRPQGALVTEPVQRRLRRLAKELGLEAEVVLR